MMDAAPAPPERYEEDVPVPTMPTSGSSSRPKSPIVHGTYEKADSDDDEVMVKTEFVWADGAEHDVKLSGAWNGWMPVQMYHEGGKFQPFTHYSMQHDRDERRSVLGTGPIRYQQVAKVPSFEMRRFFFFAAMHDFLF